MVIPAVLQTSSYQDRHSKSLAFICCTQQQADPKLFGSGFVKTKVGGSFGISTKANCLRHTSTGDVTTVEQYQLWSHPDAGIV